MPPQERIKLLTKWLKVIRQEMIKTVAIWKIFLYFLAIKVLIKVEGVLVDDEIMTITDIAKYLKISDKTAYRLVSEGKIPGFKVGGSWRFNRVEILEWAKAKYKQLTDE